MKRVVLARIAKERCPSGLRSTIGNRVSREIGIVGSNPTLSVRLKTVDYRDITVIGEQSL